MDKNTVLNQTTQEAIYKYFYGDGFSVGNKISSPFSEDKHASFKVFKNLSFKCFSTGSCELLSFFSIFGIQNNNRIAVC